MDYRLTKLKSTGIMLIAVTLVNLLCSKPLAADKQFSIDYDITYDVQENGDTKVTQNVSITNQKNDVVPTTYTFTTKNMDISDTRATVNGKDAEVKKEAKTDETTITVPITSYSIGEGRQNSISLSYTTPNIAGQIGNIWNIYIPKINIPDTTIIYNVKLSVPRNFGPKIYLSPTPTIEKLEEGKSNFYFTKESFYDKGITGSFGTHQLLNFKIRYQLKNSSILSSLYEIALPPDIKGFQQVKYGQINPKPAKISTDKDGNVIAYFRIGPKKEMEIILTGSARTSGRQINPEFGGKFSEISPNLIKSYTQKEKYWETDSSVVKEISKQLKDPNLNVTKNARKAYDYVTENLNYNFNAIKQENVERKGAQIALNDSGPWTCMEFTDALIAILRSMGIPAREINGYAFTNDENKRPVSINLKGGDLLHAWVEYYDPAFGWTQVDPTWGKTSGTDYFTKLDTNRFAFVIKGADSEYPFPAGSYRTNDADRLVEVDYAQDSSDNAFEERIKTDKKFNFNLLQIIKGNKRIEIENVGGVFIHNLGTKREALAPGEKKIIYVSKDADRIEYTDFNDNKRFTYL